MVSAVPEGTSCPEALQLLSEQAVLVRGHDHTVRQRAGLHLCSLLILLPCFASRVDWCYCHAQVNEARQGEVKALATRKYLDALCVYFWVATSLLFSLFTFGLFVLLGHKLTAEVVFTSLALFNVLIAPLNSFPWVLNGTVEAVVSVRRLQGFLSSWETKSDWAYESKQTEQQHSGAGPEDALVEAQRIALAEGLTLESALSMSRADSSDLYTTINMERLPSGALPRYMSNAPSFASWSPMHRQQSTSAPAGQNLSAVERAGPPPDGGGSNTPRGAINPPLSPAARSFSTSFKGWGQGHSTPALQHQGPSSSASASSSSEAADQGIVTVLSDSNRLLSFTQSGGGHAIVLSGASFSWQPTLGRSRVVSSQPGRQNSTRQEISHQGRSGVLQPLLSEAAEGEAAASSDSLVLQELNLTVRRGDLLVVTGEIGAGDSALL